MKHVKKITAILVLGVLPILSANAAGVKEVSPGLFIPDYTAQELTSKGCEPEKWDQLVKDYVAKRVGEEKLEIAQTNQLVERAPGLPGGGSCFQSAMDQIIGASEGLRKLLKLFSGGFDIGALLTGLINYYANQACQQINYTLGEVLAPVTGAIPNVPGAVPGIYPANSAQMGITPYQMPYAGTTTNNPNTTQQNSSSGGFFSRINPFKSDVQNVPDPLK